MGFDSKFVLIRGLLALGTLFLLSCAPQSRTRLIVVFISDLELNQIDIEIKNLNPARETSETISATGGLIEFPGSFVIEADENGRDAQFTVLFTATGPNQTVMLSQRVRTNFVPYETRKLPIYFNQACLGVTCSDTELCNEDGQCENYWREANTLDEVSPEMEFDDL